jgi:acyl transferase domain-containing protein
MSEEQSRSAGNWTTLEDESMLCGAGGWPVRITQGDLRVRGLRELLALVGELWVQGAGIDLAKLYEGADIRRVPLPPRPFERRRHWIEPGDASAPRGAATDEHQRGSKPTQHAGRYTSAQITDYLVGEIGVLLGGRQHA